MTDFTGFYFNGIHSSTYGILRISDGDRYTEGLIPDFEDHTLEPVGGDGSLYGGRNFKPVSFSINIAFDHVTEKQFRGLRTWLGGEELKEFRFDERPYKSYWVKLESKPEISYICFLEDKEDGFPGEKERIYKGEGTLSFIAYYPFGLCKNDNLLMTKNGLVTNKKGRNWQILDTYVPFNILDDNVNEWADASSLKNSTQLVDYNIFTSTLAQGYKYQCLLYNAGDFESDFELFFSFPPSPQDGQKITISLESEGKIEYFIFTTKSLGGINRILLKTKNHSLLTFNTSDKEIPRYDLVDSTHWLKIPKGYSTLRIKCGNLNLNPPQIKYDYKYY